MDEENTPLLTITEAATFLNVSKATIRRWTDEGRLPCLRIGARKERRFQRAELLALIEQTDVKQGPTQATASAACHSGHKCIVSNNQQEEWAAIGPAILAALQQGSQVVLIEASDRKQRLERLLIEHGMSMSTFVDSHQLSCVSIEDSYLLSGEFRWERAVAFIESAILAAKARGFANILVIGANAAQADSDPAVYAREMKDYELGLDQMLARHPNASVLCPYTADEISAQLMVQGFVTHPQMQVYSKTVPGLLGQVSI